jgi:hypothetical protein
MFILIEGDGEYAGFGVDWYSYIRGFRIVLGYVAIAIFFRSYPYIRSLEIQKAVDEMEGIR